MDLITVRDIRTPRSRDELRLQPGETPLGGGTWLYSERQTATTLVDLTAMGWPEVDETDAALTLAATCRLATVYGLRSRDWAAAPLFEQTTNSLLASFKVWNVATIGGNLCFSVPAGAMTSLGSALDAVALIWGADEDRRVPIAEFVTGVQSNVLRAGEVLRAIEFPRHALAARTGFRRASLADLGRAGTVVIARLDTDGRFVLSVTGGTTHPWVFRFEGVPTAPEVTTALDGIDDWYDDPHGSPDWREAMSRRFAEQLRVEIGTGMAQ
jgi:CO/xanthine dehydrogenase FAD-binding subunit